MLTGGMAAQALARTIAPLLAEAPGPQLALGRIALTRALHTSLPKLWHAELRASPRRLARHRGSLVVIRTQDAPLPLRPRSLGALLAIGQLGWDDASERLSTFSEALVDEGLLLLVEPLRGRLWHGLFSFGRGLRRIEPETVTTLLLNAGYTDITQHWPDDRAVVTRGTLRRLPDPQQQQPHRRDHE